MRHFGRPEAPRVLAGEPRDGSRSTAAGLAPDYISGATSGVTGPNREPIPSRTVEGCTLWGGKEEEEEKEEAQNVRPKILKGRQGTHNT